MPVLPALTAAVLAGRAAALERMGDTCTIREPSTRALVDGEYVTTPGATVYTGVCEVKPTNVTDRVVEAGGQSVSLWPYIVKVPVDGTEAVDLDHVITVDTAALDAALIGLELRVRDAPKGSLRTARRLGAEVAE